MFKFFIFILLIELVNSFEFSYSKFNNLLNDKKVKNVLNDLIEDDNKIKLINNPDQKWCENCIKSHLYNENINFDFITYNDFFNDNYNNNKDIIFVHDFMINYGRTLTINEKNKIYEYKKMPKIILNINNYDNLVLKDDNFIRKYKMFYFPNICKIQIHNYIYNLIDYYKYNDNLSLINWKKFDIDKLSFEKIEDLIFDIHLLMITDNKPLIYYEEIIHNKLSYLYKKYYN